MCEINVEAVKARYRNLTAEKRSFNFLLINDTLKCVTSFIGDPLLQERYRFALRLLWLRIKYIRHPGKNILNDTGGPRYLRVWYSKF